MELIMAKTKTPAYAKWWGKDWQQSTLRYELKSAAARGAYREFHDLCIWSPDVGWAVTGSGRPLTITEIAKQIDTRVDVVKRMISVGEAHGKIRKRADKALGLCTESVEKSLPDHSVYKRLGAKSSDEDLIQVSKHPRANQNQNQIHDDDESSSSSGEPPGDDLINAERFRVLSEYGIGGEAQLELARRPELAPGRVREICERAKAKGGRGGVIIADLRAEADRLRDRREQPVRAGPDQFERYEAEASEAAMGEDRAKGLAAMREAMRGKEATA